MKKRILWILWGVMYGICAGLAHITQRSGNQLWALPAMGGLFFVPGALLLIDGLRHREEKTLRLLRWVSGLSVGLTVIALIANVLSAFGGDVLGLVLNELLIFVSVPLFCLGNLLISLFVWCCIFFATLIKK